MAKYLPEEQMVVACIENGKTIAETADACKLTTVALADRLLQDALRKLQRTRIEIVFDYIDAHCDDGVIPQTEFAEAYDYIAQLREKRYRFLQIWCNLWQEYRFNNSDNVLRPPDRALPATPLPRRFSSPISNEREYILLRLFYLARIYKPEFQGRGSKRQAPRLQAPTTPQQATPGRRHGDQSPIGRILDYTDTHHATLPLGEAMIRSLTTPEEQVDLAINYLKVCQEYRARRAAGEDVPEPTTTSIAASLGMTQGELLRSLDGAYGERGGNLPGIIRWCYLAQLYDQKQGGDINE